MPTLPPALAAVRRRLAKSPWVPRVALGMGLFLIGGLVAHLLTPPTVEGSPVLEPLPVEPSASASSGAVVALMPDVLGLDRKIAGRVVRDAGISADVVYLEAPAAGQEGLVVDQDPQPGITPEGAVTLTTSTAVKVADLEGRPVDDARTEVESLGAVVTVERLVRPELEPGLVVETVPAAGERLTDTIVLRVSDPGESLSLASLDVVDDDGCEAVGSAPVDGVDLTDSIVCYPERKEPTFAEWNLGRKGTVLTVTLGLRDDGPDAPGQVRIFGDGRLLAESPVALGTVTPLRLDVSGVLRLRVETTSRAEDGPWVVLGEASLIGSPEDLAALQDLS